MKNLNKIKIAPDAIYEIGQDKTGYFPKWDVLNDETLCAKVKGLAHSTFDISKFTVVGTPTITNGGIASGFSGSKYIKVPCSFNTNNVVDLWFAANVNTTGFGFYGVGNFRCAIFSDQIWFYSNSSSNNSYFKCLYNTTEKDLHFHVRFDSVNGNSIWVYDKYSRLVSSNLNIAYTNNISVSDYLCFGYTTYGDTWGGPIDLKQISVAIDGVPVFSGNKTGIDTIKPNDYSTTGTPTISADGIVTFPANSQITKSMNFDAGKNIIAEGKVYLVGDATSSQSMFCFYNTSSPSVMKVSLSFMGSAYGVPNCIVLYYPQDASTSPFTNTPANIYQANKWYYYRIEIKNYKVSVYFGTDKQNLTKVLGGTNGISIYNGTTFNKISINGLANTPPTDDKPNKFDLNNCKVYVDGDLVYQSCLKIPYTEAELNQKVVDATYRNRVKDLFEQVGYNGYFTLSDNDFTLPTHKFSDVIDHKEDADGTVAEQRVDMTVMAYGVAENGTDVNLPIEFADGTSYMVGGVTVSAQDADSFTPSSSGTWFARGKGKI